MTIELPGPSLDGEVSVERALAKRRSVRDHADTALDLNSLAQLLWAAQGVTSAKGQRTAPTAGALYPLEVIVVAGRVDGLPAGAWRYRPREHDLVNLREGDLRKDLCAASLRQKCVATAPAVIVFTAIYERTSGKYGVRAERYIHLEVGHAAQNLCLQAVALGLGTVVIGAFEDVKITTLLSLPEGERPVYLLPVGKVR